MKSIIAIVIAAGFVAVVIAGFQALRNSESDELVDRSSWPATGPIEGYATSQSCRECHADQYETWRASYHRSMTQPASPASVIGQFDGVELSYLDHKYRLEKVGEHFWVELSDPDSPGGAPLRRQVVLCTGSHHMQVYWFPTNQSRILAQFPFVYLKQEQRWVPRNAAFLRPPMRQPTLERGRWNQTCIKCHTTGARPGIEDPAKMDSRISEFGIACEACHGPGAAHAEEYTEEYANEHIDGVDRDERYLADESNDTIVNPSSLSHRRSAEICGQCHSVAQFASEAHRENWKRDGFEYRPGGELSEERSIVRGHGDALRGRNLDYVRMVAGAFWSDAMVRVSGREYNGLLETACFQRGEMSCLSCHTMHKSTDDPRSLDQWADDQLKPGMRSNLACTQCHQQFTDDNTLVAHTHHAASSAGSNCYNCHMPHTTYGLLKAIRSHHLSNPSVAASVETGRPNACNQCHLDRTLDWAAQHLSAWYGLESPVLSRDQQSIAASVLWTLQGDAAQRALMAWTFGWKPAQQASGTIWTVPFLAELINDPYDAVRCMAYRSLHSIGPYAKFQYDYLAAPGDREAAKQRLLTLWKEIASQQPSPRIGHSLLLDVSGNIRREKYMRLLRDRDLRPITLIE